MCRSKQNPQNKDKRRHNEDIIPQETDLSMHQEDNLAGITCYVDKIITK